MVSMSNELIPLGILLGIICLYVFNPKDMFGLKSTERNYNKRIASIDSDTEAIVQIFSGEFYDLTKTRKVENLQKELSFIDSNSQMIVAVLQSESYDKAVPENIQQLAKKFSLCYQRLHNSNSSFYRFFASASYRTSLNLTLTYGPFPDDIYKLFGTNLDILMMGLKNKDLIICYECIANLLYMSFMRREPKERLSDKATYQIFEILESLLKNFPCNAVIIIV